jgi:hypothetical protein
VSVLGPSQESSFALLWGADSNPHANCGAYTGSWTTSGLLTADDADRIMTAYAPFGTLLQTFSFPYTISRSSNTAFAITATAQVTVTRCFVVELALSTVPQNLEVRVGVDPQPANVAFVTAQTPDCQAQTFFTLTSPNLSFGLLQTIDINSGQFIISGATNAEHGVYTVSLSAVNDQTITSSFTITITNPCSQTTFEFDPNPL